MADVNRIFRLGLLLVALMAGVQGMNASAQILDEKALESAEGQALQREIGVLDTIQRGIALSVAECELVESCNASVSRAELEQIISLLDTRVNTLSLRYTETADSGLESILLAYADMRDSYKQILEKMTELPQFAAEQTAVNGLETDDFFTAGGIPDELLELFQDADEELVDDFTENRDSTETDSSGP